MAVAGLVASFAVAPSPRLEFLRDLLNRIDGVKPTQRIAVAIDGVDGAGKTHLAHELSALVDGASDRPYVNVTLDQFHRPRPQTDARGRSAQTFYRDSYDYDAFLACVMQPLRAGDPITPGVWDVETDSPRPPVTMNLPANTVVLVDGIFLQRPELVDIWDASIWVDVPFEISVPRGNARFGHDLDVSPESPANARYVGDSACTWHPPSPCSRRHGSSTTPTLNTRLSSDALLPGSPGKTGRRSATARSARDTPGMRMQGGTVGTCGSLPGRTSTSRWGPHKRHAP